MPSQLLKFSDRYDLKEELGKGAFSIVYRCVDRTNNKEYAAKVIKKDRLERRDLFKLESEARICKKLDHPNIVKLHAIVCEKHMHYFVFDLVTGGELFDDIVKCDNYTEELAAKCMVQLINAIKYIHKMGVVHRDLKPENILLENDETKTLKVADFGLAVEVEDNELKWFGLAGTTHYMAPEVLAMTKYGKPVDMWACGVIMYILLVGYQPFYNKNEWRLQAMIKTADYDMSSEPWITISGDAKDLITKLLCVVPSRRFTADQAFGHPWFKNVKTLQQYHSKDTVERLKLFNARRKFKAAVHTIKVAKTLRVAKDGQNGPPGSTSSSSGSSSARK